MLNPWIRCSSSYRRHQCYDNAPGIPHTCFSVRTISTLVCHLSATWLFPIGCSSAYSYACLLLYFRTDALYSYAAACAASLERVTSRLLTCETCMIILHLVAAESRTFFKCTARTAEDPRGEVSFPRTLFLC